MNDIEELVRVVQISKKYHKEHAITDKNRLILEELCMLQVQVLGSTQSIQRKSKE